MSVDNATRIERIRGKIAACAEIYSKMKKTPWPTEMNPVLSEQEIQAFEERYKIQLPDDYRLFLKEVGNGGVGGPANTGLLSLNVLEGERPDKPFPLTDAWDESDDDIIEEQDEESDEESDDEVNDESVPNYYRDGSIYLCSFGCGEHARLIVSGPERGNVWIISPEGAYYAEGPEATEDSEPTRIDFLQWYENWLDERLEMSAPSAE